MDFVYVLGGVIGELMFTVLGIELTTQSLTSVQPLSYVSCKPRDRYRCKQKAGELGGHDPHTTQHATWCLGTQVREDSPQRETWKSYKEKQESSLLVRGPRGGQGGHRRDKCIEHCRP